MTRQIVVDVIGDSSKFNKATGDAITHSENLTGKLQGIGKGMVIGAGIGAFNLLTGAVDLAVGKLGDAHQAFLDDQLSSEKLAQALKNNVPGWDGNTAGAEAFASAAEQMGFSDDEARDSLGQLVGVTHDVNAAQQLSSLAMDLARAKGIDLATATDIVTKAQQGNGKALKSLGIDTMGAKDAAGLLDAIQKNVTGSAAAWAQTNTGKLAVSNQKVQEAMEKVGAAIDQVSQVAVPILADAFTVAVKVFADVWKAIQPVITTVANALIPAFRTAMSFVTGTVIPTLTTVAKTVMPALESAAKFLSAVIGQVFGVIGTVVKGLTTLWGTEFAIIGKVLGVLGDAARTLYTGVSTAFGNIVTFISGMPGKVASAARGMWDGITSAFRNAINAVIRIWNNISFTFPSIPNPLGGTLFGGFTIGTPNIPYMHSGGIVPGPPGANVPTILQAGELVVPRNRSAGLSLTLIVNGNVYGDGGIAAVADDLAAHLRLIGATS